MIDTPEVKEFIQTLTNIVIEREYAKFPSYFRDDMSHEIKENPSEMEKEILEVVITKKAKSFFKNCVNAWQAMPEAKNYIIKKLTLTSIINETLISGDFEAFQTLYKKYNLDHKQKVDLVCKAAQTVQMNALGYLLNCNHFTQKQKNRFLSASSPLKMTQPEKHFSFSLLTVGLW